MDRQRHIMYRDGPEQEVMRWLVAGCQWWKWWLSGGPDYMCLFHYNSRQDQGQGHEQEQIANIPYALHSVNNEHELPIRLKPDRDTRRRRISAFDPSIHSYTLNVQNVSGHPWQGLVGWETKTISFRAEESNQRVRERERIYYIYSRPSPASAEQEGQRQRCIQGTICIHNHHQSTLFKAHSSSSSTSAEYSIQYHRPEMSHWVLLQGKYHRMGIIHTGS